LNTIFIRIGKFFRRILMLALLWLTDTKTHSGTAFRAICVRALAQGESAFCLPHIGSMRFKSVEIRRQKPDAETRPFDHLDCFGILVGRETIKNYYSTGY
jgi:hypothetical protein